MATPALAARAARVFSFRLLPALLALAVLTPAQARADSILIIKATGTAKQRNIDKVTRSLEEKATSTPELSISPVELGADCVLDLACLASAGKDSGATTVIGVHLAKEGGNYVLLFIGVDVATGSEVARHEVQNVRRKALPEISGEALLDFFSRLPTAPTPAPEEVTPAPVEEVAPPEEVVPPVEENVLEESAFEEPTEVEPEMILRADLSEEGENDTSYAVELGLATALVLPQVSSELSTTAGIELDVGVPVWKALSVLGSVGYSQPGVDSNLEDPRIDGEMYSTDTTQRELTMTVGGTWRFLKSASRLNVYAGLGGRIWLLETKTNGSVAGMKFGENQETSTRYGAAGWVGGEFLLGPGALAAELDMGGSDLPHLVTGDVATTAVAVQVGYRLRL